VEQPTLEDVFLKLTDTAFRTEVQA